MKRALIPAALGLAAGILFLFWPDAAVPPLLQTDEANPASNIQATLPDTAVAANVSTVRVGDQALTLAGTTLQPTPAVTALFEGWLSTTQSQRYEQWKTRALAQAESLPPEAQGQLSRWLDQYVELNLALQLMTVDGEPTWQKILASVRSARGEYFSASELAMFRGQIALENFTQSAVDALNENSDPLSQLSGLTSAASDLPDTERAKAEQMLTALSQSLQQNPALADNPQAWQKLLQARAAATLQGPSVDLTEANADFLKRYNVYNASRETLIQQGASDDQLESLRNSQFSGAELMRAKTFDKALAQ